MFSSGFHAAGRPRAGLLGALIVVGASSAVWTGFRHVCLRGAEVTSQVGPPPAEVLATREAREAREGQLSGPATRRARRAGRMELQAHRGFGDGAQHDSLWGFLLTSFDPRITSIEFDIHATADGVLAVNHDSLGGKTFSEWQDVARNKGHDPEIPIVPPFALVNSDLVATLKADLKAEIEMGRTAAWLTLREPAEATPGNSAKAFEKRIEKGLNNMAGHLAKEDTRGAVELRSAVELATGSGESGLDADELHRWCLFHLLRDHEAWCRETLANAPPPLVGAVFDQALNGVNHTPFDAKLEGGLRKLEMNVEIKTQPTAAQTRAVVEGTIRALADATLQRAPKVHTTDAVVPRTATSSVSPGEGEEAREYSYAKLDEVLRRVTFSSFSNDAKELFFKYRKEEAGRTADRGTTGVSASHASGLVTASEAVAYLRPRLAFGALVSGGVEMVLHALTPRFLDDGASIYAGLRGAPKSGGTVSVSMFSFFGIFFDSPRHRSSQIFAPSKFKTQIFAFIENFRV